MASSEPLLSVSGLDVFHGKVQALRGAALEVNEGEVVALIGPNGAGKTTLLETILGINTPASGAIRFGGRRIEGRPPERIVPLGVSLVPEGRGVFSAMSVLDNLLLGAHHSISRAGERLTEVFDLFPVLALRKSQIAATLSGGERRMLAIGRALMASPRLVMMDEPSLGLAPRVVEEVFSLLPALSASGMTILLAEQNAVKALAFSDRGYVLEKGQVKVSGDSAVLRDMPGVRAAYLGV